MPRPKRQVSQRRRALEREERNASLPHPRNSPLTIALLSSATPMHREASRAAGRLDGFVFRLQLANQVIVMATSPQSKSHCWQFARSSIGSPQSPGKLASQPPMSKAAPVATIRPSASACAGRVTRSKIADHCYFASTIGLSRVPRKQRVS